MGPSVWITGLGAVSCLGGSVNELWNRARADQSGIRNGLGLVEREAVKGSESGNRALDFCVSAAREAMSQAGWGQLGPRDGLILATTTGLFLQWDRAFTSFVNQELPLNEFRAKFVNQPFSVLSDQLADVVGRPGVSSVVTSACAASTQALGIGAMWIKSGRVDRCLVAGVEVLCDLTCEGFRSLQLLSNDPATPFDRDRKGINLSEGAAFVCLERGEFASASGLADRGLARLSGYGFSTDAFHMTGPHPEGEGSYRAMNTALKVAGVSPDDVDWVHAHGTGSQQNDSAEGLAIVRLFTGQRPWVSSTKWLHGHALGASGALESVLVVKAMSEGVILKTCGLTNPDERIHVRHPEADLNQRARHVVKNTLGFGGTNAALVFSNGELA